MLLRNVRLFVVLIKQTRCEAVRGRRVGQTNMLSSHWKKDWINPEGGVFHRLQSTHGSCLSWNRSSSILVFTDWPHRRFHIITTSSDFSAPRRATCSWVSAAADSQWGAAVSESQHGTRRERERERSWHYMTADYCCSYTTWLSEPLKLSPVHANGV